MRKPKTSDKTTAELLKEAATKLFARYGYEGTTVRDIAAMAGVTAGQITVNFESKEKLFNEIVRDLYDLACKTFDPIIGHYHYMKQKGDFTEEQAWELIDQIITTQIEFSTKIENMDLLRIMSVHLFNDNLQTSSMLAQITINKIEHTLAQLFLEVFEDKHYLHARTVSRAVNGAITTFAEHPELLYSEVLSSKHMPDSQKWMVGYIKRFVMNSIAAEAKVLPESN